MKNAVFVSLEVNNDWYKPAPPQFIRGVRYGNSGILCSKELRTAGGISIF